MKRKQDAAKDREDYSVRGKSPKIPDCLQTSQLSDDSASFLRAARGGNTEKVLEYLKNGTDINTCNANGLNALHLASKEGHVHIVQDLLARGAKIDSATKKGNTALHIASLAGQHEVVKILVSHSASVNVQSQNGFTPLYMAAQENHDEVVRFLLASGASQSLATEDGFTPLAVALQQGHDKVVAVLLENDTRGKVRLPALHIAAKKDDTKAAALLLQNDHNPDVTSKSGFTPLHIAAHYGNENIAVVLLQRGADVNYSAKHNITPLHVAAKWGKGNMVGLLLDKGANLEARTRDGLTPLHCAARSGHENVVDMMLQRGAPISAKTKNGLAPLHMASQGDHVDAARILLHHKAPVDEVTVDYLTALHVAAHCGHVRVAKLLLDRKADPNSRALNGFTPLHIACKKNRIKVVELLLKYGASIEATTESGLTPLHVASFMGCMNIVIFLIQHQASPDEATVRGETPLHLAARANQTDIIRILLRNGAKVDARAREQQTPLHIASRLGNVDIVVLLLQSGAQVDAVTKDLYTALHIAAKEGQEEVASILMDHGASMSAATKKGFTPLHLSAKYGNMKVAKLLIAKDAPVDAEGKNGVTPLHVAVHYDNQNVAMLLLDKSASPHACAKNGYTPLHISAKKNQLDIAKTLLDYGAKVDAESKAGFSPLHLAGQEGHIEIASLLIKQGADVNAKAKNGLTPIHLCAQEDKVEVAQVLVDSGADCDSETKAGYTPLHVAAHFGQMNMVKFLLGQGVRVDVQNELGYSPLHQAAQQGHSQIVNLLLEANASPNTISNNGQTALSIAQKLGYISVVETLKVVTDTVVTTTTTTTVEEKYKVLAPESMQETFMSDSEDEGGEEPTNDQSYKYLTTEEMLKIPDDSMPMDITSDTNEKKDSMNRSAADPYQQSIEQTLIRMENQKDKPDFGRKFDEDYKSDNVALSVPPVSAGVRSAISHVSVATSIGNQSTTSSMWRERFLVSFMVDARGGAMRGCRHSGVRVIIPPRKAPMPMRVTCRYLKKDKLIHPPPLMEGEAIASRVLELGPAGAKFLGPVIIEVPHFASLRGKEREIVILRSDNGESWREHTLEATEEAVQDVLQDSFDEGETTQLEDLNTNRITRILTTDFPQYFAIISRIRQEVHAIGPEGGVVNSTVVPQVQAVFPQGALTKKIKVGLQAQPIPPELTAKLLGNRVAVSPIVTVEPRRRKFHKPITLTIPVPVAASKGMINQYSGDTPTLRLLCSITGGTTRAQWEDVTGSTPLTFVNDCVNFTTTVSARFWLMDCRNVAEATKLATSLYKEAIHVPFMAKFCVFSKRHELLEARMRVFCMTDDKEDKTLEHQEHFHEVAKSRDVEVLEGKTHHLEFFGNLFPVTKSGDQLSHKFHAFRENRLPFTVRVKDPNNDPMGRISFFREPKQARGEAQQPSICNLNIALPDDISPEPGNVTDQDILAIQAKYSFLREAGYGKFDTIHRADLRVSDISNLLGHDWVKLARELEIDDQDINLIISEYPDNVGQQAMVMLRLWLNTEGNKATGNALEKALKQCDRQDIVNKCMFNIEMVTDNAEQEVAQSVLAREEGYDAFKKELSPVNNSTLKPLTRDYSIDVNVDESEYAHENFVAAERLAGITEEISSHSDTINETSLKQEEATSVYEREEQKYVAEEKEFASSYHKEVQQEQMSTNQITQSQVLETTQRENNIITERTENRNDYVHEEMKKMSIEEKQSMKIVEGDRVMEKTTESKMEEEHNEKEMYNNEMSETKQSKTEEREDGTVLILTENKKQSREAFMTESHDTRHYEQAEIMTGVDPSEAVTVTESKFASETYDQAAGVSSGATAATAQIFTQPPDSFPQSLSKTNAQSNIPTTTLGSVRLETNLSQGVEISQDPKETYSSQFSETHTSLEGSNKHVTRKEENYSGEKKISRISIEHTDSPLESPLTESAQWSDTGISSLDVTGDKFSKGRRMHLELQDTTADTDIEYSELSPSPVGQGQVIPALSPVLSTTFESPMNQKIGKIQIHILRARDIENRAKFGKADPYVNMTLGKQKTKSPTIKNNLNPEWNFKETFDVDLHSPRELLVEVFDEDIGKDDFLGKVSIDLNNILQNRLSESTWVPLENCTSGEVLLSADFMPANIPISSTPISGRARSPLESSMKELDIECDRDISQSSAVSRSSDRGESIEKSLSRERSLQKTDSASVESSTFLPETPGTETFREEEFLEVDPNTRVAQKVITQKTFPGGKVNMTLVKAKELRKKDIFSKSDPYAVISVGKQSHKTKTMKNTHEPEWNHDIHLEERSPSGSEVKIHIFNKKSLAKDDSLGYIIFNTKELFHHPKLINRWIKLEGTKSGQILLAAEFIENELETPEVTPIVESIEIPVTKEEKDRVPIKKGRMMVEFIKAKHLKKKGGLGKPDPYLKINIGDDKFSSPVVRNDTNPEWKYPIEFNIDENSSKMLNVEVFDENFGKDDLLGTVELPISELCDNPNSTTLVPLKGGNAGSILYFSQFIPTEMIGTILDVSEVRPEMRTQEGTNETEQKATTIQESSTKRETIIMETQTSTNKIIINEEAISEENDVEEKVKHLLDNNSRVMSIEIPKESLDDQYHTEVISNKLIFKLIEARDLKNTDIVGKADPYAVLKYKNVIYKSQTVNNNLNPRWDFTTELDLPSDENDKIEVTVFDEDYGKDDMIGQAIIDLSQDVQTTQEKTKWISLDRGGGDISYCVAFKKVSKEEDQASIETSVKRPSEIIKEFEQIAEKSTVEKVKDETSTIKLEQSSIKEGLLSQDTEETKILSKDIILDDSLPALETMPLIPGQVTITVHKARNVEDKGLLGKADPYVVLNINGTKYQSKTVNNNLNPEWNFVTSVNITEKTQSEVIIAMYDDDFGKDDALGLTSIDLHNIVSKQQLKDQWIPLQNCKSGEILLSAEFKSTQQIKDAQAQEISLKEKTKLDTSDIPDNGAIRVKDILEMPKQASTIGKAKLTVHRGKKLEKRGLFGKADPYIVIKYKDVKFKSKTVKNTVNPDWDFTTDIEMKNVEDQQVSIQVFDDDIGKDDPMGQTVFNLNELKAGPISNRWIRLDKCKSGQILVSGEFTQVTIEKDVEIVKPIPTPVLPIQISLDSKQVDIANPTIQERSELASESTEEIISKEIQQGRTEKQAELKQKTTEKGAKGLKDILNTEKDNLSKRAVTSTETSVVQENNKFIAQEGTGTAEKINIESKAEIKVEDLIKTDPVLATTPTKTAIPQRQIEAGQIIITVLKARDIEKKGMFGKADPYVKLTMGKQTSKSTTVNNNYNPEWNFETKFDIHTDTTECIEIAVFDDDFGKDDSLGSKVLDIKTIQEKGKSMNQWIPLDNCKSGEILVSTEFISINITEQPIQRHLERVDKIEDKKDVIIEDKSVSLNQQDIKKVSIDDKQTDARGAEALAKTLNEEHKMQISIEKEEIPQIKTKEEIFSQHIRQEQEVQNKTKTNEGAKGLRDTLNIEKDLTSECLIKSEEASQIEEYKETEAQIELEPTAQESTETFPIPSKQKSIESGQIIITVYKARDIEKKGMFGKADPYVKIILGEQNAKSATVKNNHNPEWNFKAIFAVDKDTNKKVNISVFDDDFGKDDSLGNAVLDIALVQKNKQLLNKWVPLENCKSGEILISSEFLPLEVDSQPSAPIEPSQVNLNEVNSESDEAIVVTDKVSKLTTPSVLTTESVKKNIREEVSQPENRTEILSSITPQKKPLETGQIIITVYKAREIEKKGMFGKADPYVKMSLGEQKAKSATVKNNHNPEWNFKAIFAIDNNTSEKLTVAVYDDDFGKDDTLGNIVLDISYIQQKQLLNQWIPLENCKSGEVLLSAEFIPLAKIQQSAPVGSVSSKEDPKVNEPKPKETIEVKVQEVTTIKSDVQVSESTKEHAQETVLETKDTKELLVQDSKITESVVTSPTPVSTEQKPLKAGQILITVFKARDIEKKGKFGKADPYVKMTLGEQKAKSATVKNNHNPEWNFKATFDIDESTNEGINIAVFDDDFGKDDSLGNTVLDITKVQEQKQLLNQWIALEKCKSGEVLISAEFIPLAMVQIQKETEPIKSNEKEKDIQQPSEITKHETISEDSPKEEVIQENVKSKTLSEKGAKGLKDIMNKDKKTSSEPTVKSDDSIPVVLAQPDPLEPGQIIITVHKARDIEKKGMFGKADPYVIMTLGDQKSKSKTIKNNYNPEWEQTAKFNITKDTTEGITISVFDDDIGKDDSLGTTIVDLHSVQEYQKLANQWIPLEKCKSGEVLISAEFIPLALVEIPKSDSPLESNSTNDQIKEIETKPTKTVDIEVKDSKNILPVIQGSVEEKKDILVKDSKVTESVVVSSPTLGTSQKKPMESGQILITVFKARDIEKKGNYKADPYVKLSLGKQKAKSSKVINDHNPEWNFKATFEINESTTEGINIAVLDDDFGKDDSLGNTVLDITKVQEQKQLLNQWIPLKKCKSGEVLISAEFIPLAMVQVQKEMDPIKSNEKEKDIQHPSESTKHETLSEDIPKEELIQEDIKSKTVNEKGAKGLKDIMNKDKKTSSEATVRSDDSIPVVCPKPDPLEPGQIIITVHKARDIEKKGMFGKADPYVIMTLGDQKSKSKTIKNNYNPEWEQTAKFNITKDTTEGITISVFDDDFGKDDTLGTTIIDLCSIQEYQKFVNQWIPLEKCKSGEVLVSAEFIPLAQVEPVKDLNSQSTAAPSETAIENVSNPQQTEEYEVIHEVSSSKFDKSKKIDTSSSIEKETTKGTKSPSKDADEKLSVTGEINVTVHKARKIENKGKFGKVDPYVTVSLGDQTFKSKTIKNDQNPNWEYSSKFTISEHSPNQVNFTVLDDDLGKDDRLGTARINISDILTRRQILNEWLSLNNCNSGEIQITTNFVPADSLFGKIEPAAEVKSQTVNMATIDKNISENKEPKIIVKEQTDNNSKISINTGSIDKPDAPKIESKRVKTGTLFFTLISAKDLEKSDYIGKSDPYAVIQYKDQTFRSSTVNNDLNPVWNFPVTLEIVEEDAEDIIIRIYDEDYDKDDEIGKAAVKVQDLIECKNINERCIKLVDCKSGELKFSSTYLISEAGDVLKETPSIADRDIKKSNESVKVIASESSLPKTITSVTSQSSRRVIKTVDSQGNVTEKIITEEDPGFSLDDNEFKNQFMTSLPQTTRTSVTSSGIVRITDSDGKVTERPISGDHGDNFGFKDEELRKHFSSMKTVTTKTSTSSRNIVRTVDSEGNITETIINEGDMDVPTVDKIHSTIMSPVPVAVTTTSLQTSRKIIKTTDASGNIIEEVIDEPVTEATKIEKIPAKGDLNIKPENNDSSKPSSKLVAANEGKLIFTLVGAKDLENSDYIGKSDPYAVVQYKDEIFKSKTISNDLNPAWNLKLELTVTEEDDGEIHIQVFDEDYNGDDELGKTSIKIKDLIASKIIDCKSIKLEHCKSGEIQFSSSYSIIINEEMAEKTEEVLNMDVNTTEVTLPKKMVQKTESISVSLPKETTAKGSIKKSGKASSGTLQLTLVGAKDLDNADYMGKSDPYVVVRYKDQTFKSETVSNNLNPIWNFCITLEIIETDSGFIYIQVYDEDYNGDDEIGKTAIKVQDLINSGNIDGNWVKLEDCKGGHVQFSSKYSPIMIEDTFCDSTVEVSQEPKKLKPADRVEKDNGDKGELLSQMSDLGIENIELVSGDKKISMQAGEEISSVTGKLEFDLNSTQTKYDITETQERQPIRQDYSQNFDKIVKKSCKKIIRRMDSDGNIIEEVVEEGKYPENWETSTVNMSSGIEVITGHSKKTSIKKTIDELGNVISEDVQTSYDKDSDVDFAELYKTGFTAIPIKKTSVTTTKRIIKRIDEEGNVIEETFEGDDNDIIPDFETRSTPVSIRRTSTQTSRKVIKRIDEDGNVTEEIITESDGNPIITSDELRSQFFPPQNLQFENDDVTSFPQTRTSMTSSSSRRVIKTVDSEGNVTEKIITEGDPNFSLDENEFRNQFMTSLPQTTRTSVTSRRMVKMIDSDGNVTERVIDEGDDDNVFDNDELRKHFTSMQPITTKTSMTSRKVIKTVDSEGNVTEEIINEGDMDDAGNDDFKTTVLSSIPVAVKRTSFKTTRKIIRKTDESGNVTEEIIDEPVTESSNWEQMPTDKDFDVMCTTVKRTINTSGKVVDEQISVSQPDDISQIFDSIKNIDIESSLPTAVKRTSIKTTKSIIKRYDDQGNLIEETIDDTNPIIESEVWKRASVEIPSTMQVTSSNTCMTTIKTTVDEQGNVVNEEISTIESIDPSSNLETSSEKLQLISVGSEFKEVQDTQENGKLIFTLHSAKNLENKDWVGKSDPYALVTLGQTVCKTQTITNNLNPEFEQEMIFQINKTSPSSLNIELFDEDITRDDCLGNTAIDVLQIKKQGKVVRQSKVLSNSKTGEIIYSIKFIPEVKDKFCDSTVESCLKEPRKLKPVDRVEKLDEEKSELLLRMSDLGIENIELVSEDKREDVLLKDVIDLQASTKKKISGLMKTIQQVELDTTDGSPQVYSRKIDSDGNVVEEVIDSIELHGKSDNQIISSRKISQTTVRKTVKILDGEGNVIEEREVDKTADGSNFDFGMLSNISAHGQSPTFDDIVYSEYPHLTKPIDQSGDILSSNFSTSSHSVQYFHSSSEPFQNIASLRAHFVQAFDEDVPVAKSTESDPAVKDVKFDDSISSFFGNADININRSVSSSTQLFSSTHSFSRSEFSSNKSAAMESNGNNHPNLYMLASEEPSLEELVSESNSNVVTEAPQTHAFLSSSSHSTSPDQCLSGSQSQRSPVPMLKANSPVLFQSLPSSPKKKNSVKKVITSELFSSDKDISRSLELVYTEPNEDPKEKLSNIYKSVAPMNKNLVNRKPSFTQLKRPSIDTQFEIMTGSPSPEWKVTEGKSVEFTPCDFTNDYSFQTKSSSITQSIQISPTSPQECQISKDICSKDPPCFQLFEPKSQSSVRSPERKFQYVQGLEEQYSANVEERIETFQKEDMVTKLTENPQTGLKDSLKQPNVGLDNILSREQSFVYDTSVEAFGSKGALIDESIKLVEEESLPPGISIVGKITDLEETINEKDVIIEFIESNTPSKESQVEKFEYEEKQDFDFNEEDISFSPVERPESELSDIINVETNDSLKIPLSSSPLKVETLFLTESAGSQTSSPKEETERIEIPQQEVQNRRLSNISVEDGNKISSTPEGEKYFMKREESFISKVEKGEVDNLAVEISDYYNLDTESTDITLCVKPIESTPETEIEIRDFRSESNLTVKPIDQVVRRIPVSSYEQIYDTVSIEDIAAHSKMSASEIMSSLGDRFQGTHEIPEFISSFEDLYQRSASGMADDIVTSALKATTELPGERWSAPAGAIEPPILEANEFSNRFDPLQHKIENHWEAIEIMMSTETLIGQEQESSKKPSSN